MFKVGTVGADLKNMAWKLPDPSKLWTNDIQQTEEYLGIEAALQMINAELQRALSVDAYVDPRHTLLLTETMTRCGTVSGLNRNNMENLGASTLACAAFERTLPVLEEAAFYGLKDPLRGSLERQILGLPLRVGTGIVGIVNSSKQAIRPSILAPLSKVKHDTSETLAPLPKKLQHFALEQESIGPLRKGASEGKWIPFVSAPISPTLEYACEDLTVLASKWTSLQTSGIVFLRTSVPTTEEELLLISRKMDTYLGWDNPLECSRWIQTTEVQWATEGDAQFCTISDFSQSASTGKALKFHVQKSVERMRLRFSGVLEGSIHTHKIIAPDLVPDCIIPSQVRIRQRRNYTKEGWHYILTKLWQAPTILECEANLLTQPPQCLFSTSVANTKSAQTIPSLNVQETLLAKLHSCI